jgi:hypothetical protein
MASEAQRFFFLWNQSFILLGVLQRKKNTNMYMNYNILIYNKIKIMNNVLPN